MRRQLINKSVTIRANPKAAYGAFIDPKILISWLHAHSAVIALCKNGPYSIGWNASDDGDYYVCSGKIKNFEKNKLLKFSDIAYYLANKKLIDKLNLSFNFLRSQKDTIISFSQSGIGEGKKWKSNFEAVATSWEESLYLLKTYFEKEKTND